MQSSEEKADEHAPQVSAERDIRLAGGDATIVCCIEAGPLEAMTIRLAASLRHFGGALAKAPIVAVTPRRGLALTKESYAALDRFEVEHIVSPSSTRYSWNNFMNKPQAMLVAQEHCHTDTMLWLDSDILVTGDLQGLLLPCLPHQDCAQFAACPVDKNVGSTGPSDENEAFWQAVCRALDLDIDSLPWVTTWAEGVDIRCYYNSGVFAYERQGDFAMRFWDYCHTLLDAHIASRHAGIFFTDQVALGLAAHSLGLPTKILEHRYNFAMGSKELAPKLSTLDHASILHYHDAFWAHQWPQTMDILQRYRPDIHDFIKPWGPLQIERTLPQRLALKAFILGRAWQGKRHLASCTIY